MFFKSNFFPEVDLYESARPRKGRVRGCERFAQDYYTLSIFCVSCHPSVASENPKINLGREAKHSS